MRIRRFAVIIHLVNRGFAPGAQKAGVATGHWFRLSVDCERTGRFFFPFPERFTGLIREYADGEERLRTTAPDESERVRGSALRELEATARAALTVLLALLHPAVARDETRSAQRILEPRVGLDQGARETEQDRTALARMTAAVDPGEDVVLAFGAGHLERRDDRETTLLGAEELLEVALVDLELALAVLDANAGHRRLATSGSPVESTRGGTRDFRHCDLFVSHVQPCSLLRVWCLPFVRYQRAQCAAAA